MYQKFRITTILLLAATLMLGACNKVPETANYIPSDAMFVAGINTKELSKKIAWNAIAGSDIFKKMMEQGKASGDSTNPLIGIEDAGIRFMGTSYVYTKPDARFAANLRVVAVIPLDDAGKWEAYVQKVTKKAVIREQKDHKECLLGSDVVAGWNKEILVIMNTITKEAQEQEISAAPMDSAGNISGEPKRYYSYGSRTLDTVQTTAELSNVFAITKDNALVKEDRFKKLIEQHHDISMWVNYEALMNQTISGQSGMPQGAEMVANLTRQLWKGNVYTGSLDFENGKIVCDMKAYFSDSMKKIVQQFTNDNIDKEMLDRLATHNLDLVSGVHISTKAISDLLTQMGVISMANDFLQPQGLSVATVLDAFAGDMVVALNDFKLVNKAADPAYGGMAQDTYDPQVNVVFALKIGNRESFNKILQLGINTTMLKSSGPNLYTIGDEGAPKVFVLLDDKYAVVSNHQEEADAFLQGKNKGQKMPSEASDVVYGHPSGFFLDIKQLLASVDKMPYGNDYSDSVTFTEAKKLFSHISARADAFKGDSYDSHMELVFQNKNENSLMQLFGFAMTLNQANKKEQAMRREEYNRMMSDTSALRASLPIVR